MNLLEVRDISFSYRDQKNLLSHLSFEADAGEIVAINGSSGIGKTTLLKIICQVIPTIFHGDLTGNVFINGKNIRNFSLPQLAPQISLLMQEPENQIFLPIVEQELAFGAENLCVPADEIKAKISNTLKLLQIEKIRYHDTATLSYGQKKLVAFASLIILSPQIFLLDEISAGLSKKHLEIVINVIKQLAADGKLIIIADHLDDILKLADKTINLDQHNV